MIEIKETITILALTVLILFSGSGCKSQKNKRTELVVVQRKSSICKLSQHKKEAVYLSEDGKYLTAIFNSETRTVTVVSAKGHKAILPQAVSASGIRYSNGKEIFWEHQDNASFWQNGKLVFQGSLGRVEK